MQADCLDVLPRLSGVKTIFVDPPDNLGLPYGQYKDSCPLDKYYAWLRVIILESLPKCETFWMSYYWRHDLELKHTIRDIIKYRHPLFTAKTFIWRYTFGQHTDTDCGSGFRYLVRLTRSLPNTDNIREQSERQRMGDPRASSRGRVPDDVWAFDFDNGNDLFDIPRVVGNAAERQSWHPTQHPIALMERIVKMSGGPVVDLCCGTGSTLRALRNCQMGGLGVELDAGYVAQLPFERITMD